MRTLRIGLLFLLYLLTGCSAGALGTRTNAPGGGPHPHISAAGAVHVGPVELLHSAVINAKPVTDLTVATMTVRLTDSPPYLSASRTDAPLYLSIGAGWQWSRAWGVCDSEGFNCAMKWSNGYAVSAGATYRRSPLRIDLRAYSFDNSPVGADSSLPLYIESLVLLFGFSI